MLLQGIADSSLISVSLRMEESIRKMLSFTGMVTSI